MAVHESLLPLFKIRTESAVHGSLHSPLEFRTDLIVLHPPFKIRQNRPFMGPCISLYKIGPNRLSVDPCIPLYEIRSDLTVR